MKQDDIKNKEELLKYLNAPLSNRGWSSAYHYTNLETIFQIYKNKSLKLSRMKIMNDVLEYKFAKDCKDFFFCLSRGKKNDYENFGMWAMYGNIKSENENKSNITEYAKNIGVKIYFPKFVLENFEKETLGVSLRLIGYADFINNSKTKKVKISTSGKSIKIKLDNRFYGYLKDNSWSYEKELRICLGADYKSNYQDKEDSDSVYIPFSEELLSKLIVYPSPRYTVDECKDIFTKLASSKDMMIPTFSENNYHSLYQDLKSGTKE